MIHIRIDDALYNKDRRFGCGLGPDLPDGDGYYFASEPGAHRADCPGCNPQSINGSQVLGTPLSDLSGRPGTEGYREFRRIAESWGHP